MSPRLLLAFLTASTLFAYFAHGHESVPAIVETDLVPMLVDNALELSGQDDPLRRSELCKSLANKLTGKLEAAARRQDREGALVLAEMLQLVMVEGVAEPLNQARVETPADSPKQTEVKHAAQEISAVAVQVGKALQPHDALPDDFQGLMKEIQAKVEEAKGEAEKRSQGKGKGPPPWAKKGKK